MKLLLLETIETAVVAIQNLALFFLILILVSSP
jgi:hypothetical protein